MNKDARKMNRLPGVRDSFNFDSQALECVAIFAAVPTLGLLSHGGLETFTDLPTPMSTNERPPHSQTTPLLYEMPENTAKPQGDIRYIGQ